MKERKITLLKNHALSDVAVGWICKYLNGNSIQVLLWINMGVKFRKTPWHTFRISWSYIASVMGVHKRNLGREIKNLISKGILKKLEPGVYTWDVQGIETLINPKTIEVVQVTKIEPEKIIIMPKNVKTNDYGLATDEYGNIIF
jgi:hypothetical protein